jgi:hypothetical protein
VQTATSPTGTYQILFSTRNVNQNGRPSIPEVSMHRDCCRSSSTISFMDLTRVRQSRSDEHFLTLTHSSKKPSEQKHQQHGAQEGLSETLLDFKNNIFSTAEVEKFVENWQNRNHMQQSFKDKQEQLNQMCEDYEGKYETPHTQMKA